MPSVGSCIFLTGDFSIKFPRSSFKDSFKSRLWFLRKIFLAVREVSSELAVRFTKEASDGSLQWTPDNFVKGTSERFSEATPEDTLEGFPKGNPGWYPEESPEGFLKENLGTYPEESTGDSQKELLSTETTRRMFCSGRTSGETIGGYPVWNPGELLKTILEKMQQKLFEESKIEIMDAVQKKHLNVEGIAEEILLEILALDESQKNLGVF